MEDKKEEAVGFVDLIAVMAGVFRGQPTKRWNYAGFGLCQHL